MLAGAKIFITGELKFRYVLLFERVFYFDEPAQNLMIRFQNFLIHLETVKRQNLIETR